MKRLLLAAAVFAGALFLHAAGAGNLPLMDRDEPRFAESSREMLERGDFVIPYFNDAPRYDKPPLVYWCQAVSYRAFGESDFAARFPSALAAALTALILFVWVSGVYGKKAGLAAAVLFSSSLQTLYLARAATADMVLAFFMTAAAWAVWEFFSGLPVRRNAAYAAYVIALAGALLTKGPVALVVPAAAAVWGFRTRRRRPAEAVLAGIFPALLLFGCWGVPAYVQSAGEFWRIGIGRHVIERALHPLEGHGASSFWLYVATLPYYLLVLVAAFFPWSVYFASLAAFFSKRGAERGDLERYFTYLVIGVFILFTPLKTKLPHYIFPALPFLAAVLAVYWSRSRRPRRALVVPAAAMAGATLVLMLAAAPRLAPSFPAFYLARESRNFLKPEMDFATVGFNEPSLVWYLRRYVHGKHIAMSENDVRAFMAIKSPRICVLPAETSYKLVSFDAGLKILYAKGINPAKGDWVELVMLVRPD